MDRAQTSPDSQAVFGPRPLLCCSAKRGRPFPPGPSLPGRPTRTRLLVPLGPPGLGVWPVGPRPPLAPPSHPPRLEPSDLCT